MALLLHRAAIKSKKNHTYRLHRAHRYLPFASRDDNDRLLPHWLRNWLETAADCRGLNSVRYVMVKLDSFFVSSRRRRLDELGINNR